ncbi:UNVERIFIED_CONTAM: hypothetical protein FKN15_007264 [Acipenser sinensis]
MKDATALKHPYTVSQLVMVLKNKVKRENKGCLDHRLTIRPPQERTGITQTGCLDHRLTIRPPQERTGITQTGRDQA